MAILLGKNIRFLRKQKGISQQELADLFQKGHTTVGNWEKGVSEPNLEELSELVNYFDISINDLVFADMSQKPIQQGKNVKQGARKANIGASPTDGMIYPAELKATHERTIASLERIIETYENMLEQFKQREEKLLRQLKE